MKNQLTVSLYVHLLQQALQALPQYQYMWLTQTSAKCLGTYLNFFTFLILFLHVVKGLNLFSNLC